MDKLGGILLEKRYASYVYVALVNYSMWTDAEYRGKLMILCKDNKLDATWCL